jgi:hypothetical protein
MAIPHVIHHKTGQIVRYRPDSLFVRNIFKKKLDLKKISVKIFIN